MARWRWITWRRRRPAVVRQQVLPFVRRSRRRDRAFKAAILAATALAFAAILAGSPVGRHGVLVASNRVRWGLGWLVGLEPPRAEIEAEQQHSRWRGVEWTRAALANEITVGGPRIERMLRAARMDPETAVIRWGNFDMTLVLSSDVFEPDDAGRSYRFKPCARSVWMTGLSLRGHPACSRCPTRRRPSPRVRRPGAGSCPGRSRRPTRGAVAAPNPTPAPLSAGSSWGIRSCRERSSATTRHLPLASSASLRPGPGCACPCSTRPCSATHPSSITIRSKASPAGCPRTSSS